MPKAKTISPRAPRNEPHKITIANQANEIRTLTARIEEMIRFRDDWQMQFYSMQQSRDEIRKRLDVALADLSAEHRYRCADVDRLTVANAEILRLKTIMEGYRLHVADTTWPDLRK